MEGRERVEVGGRMGSLGGRRRDDLAANRSSTPQSGDVGVTSGGAATARCPRVGRCQLGL